MGWNGMFPTIVLDEPLEMRGGDCPTRQDGRWGPEWRLHPGRRVHGQGRAGPGQGATLIPHSLQEVKIPKGE